MRSDVVALAQKNHRVWILPYHDKIKCPLRCNGVDVRR